MRRMTLGDFKRPERAAAEAELLAWMAEPEPREDEERFVRLALALFRVQFESCTPYRRFCEGRGRTPANTGDWRSVPAVPTGAFKEVALRGFPAADTAKVFRTSGTAAEGRGALHLDTLALYEASLVPSFERGVLPELVGTSHRARLLVLAPSPDEAPDSSLSHMFGVMMSRRGDHASSFFVAGGSLRTRELVAALEESRRAPGPVALCGTAFAFVHLLETLEADGRRLALPRSARAMLTGGFKGRARERSWEDLTAALEARLGLAPERVVDQYGMTELGSQFYDSVLRRPGEPRRKLGPPWARLRVVDPASARDVPEGSVGTLQVHDLANTGSVAVVLTADLGRTVADGFEVLGREAGAEARGCSIAADEMLGAAG